MELLAYTIDIAVASLILYFVAGYLQVPKNTIGKALIVAIGSDIIGYFAGPFVLVSLFVSLTLFFAMLIAALFIRLILIKAVYGISLGKTFSLWIVSAIVSIIVSMLIPL